MTTQYATAADRLLDHLATCRQCRSVMVRNTGNLCAKGRKLVQQTLKERHG